MERDLSSDMIGNRAAMAGTNSESVNTPETLKGDLNIQGGFKDDNIGKNENITKGNKQT